MSNEKGFLDKLFDGAEAVVGTMEKGSEYVDTGDKEEKIEDAEVVSYKPVKVIKQALIWGAIGTDHHLFEGMRSDSLCGREFELSDFKYRKTEMDSDGVVNCCGTCVRILHNKYKSS